MKAFDDLVSRFVEEIADLAKETAFKRLETYKVTLDTKPATKAPKTKATSKARKQKAQPAAAEAATPSNGNGSHGASVVNEVTVLSAIADRPGQRADQIGKALGVPANAASAIVKKLVAAGTVRTKGQRRGTTYHLAS